MLPGPLKCPKEWPGIPQHRDHHLGALLPILSVLGYWAIMLGTLVDESPDKSCFWLRVLLWQRVYRAQGSHHLMHTWPSEVPKMMDYMPICFWDRVHDFGYFGGSGLPKQGTRIDLVGPSSACSLDFRFRSPTHPRAPNSPKVGPMTVDAGQLEHDSPPTPNQVQKEHQHKPSCIHVPTFWSLL